jgi:3-carboxy-cis,cis-muconate cycloisomerase
VNPFQAIFVPESLADALSDQAWLAALLEVERALANAQALAGLLDATSAAEVAEACDPHSFDAAVLAEQARPSGNPVIPLVHALRDRGATAAHRGATSQDILDSASMLLAKDALWILDSELTRFADFCADLADAHRATVMAARTLLQQAVPTTFGYKAAGWLVGVLDARDALRALVDRLPAQLGGAAGTLASYGEEGPELLRLFAEELNLRPPDVPWHTIRTPIAELAGGLALTAGIAGKIAGDVILLAQTEVGEVSEGDGGESSTMPQKRNPARAIVAVACERHARANCAVLFESLAAEHERAAGSWHAEWHALTTALAATGGAVAAAADSLEVIYVDIERMRRNVGDDTLAEARALGHEVSAPEDYLGAVSVFIDRALERYRE